MRSLHCLFTSPRTTLLSLCLVTLALLAISSPVKAQSKYTALPQPVVDELARQGLSKSNFGLWVAPVNGGEPLLAYQHDYLFNPASTMKLVTSIAALDILGPTFSWETQVYADARPKNGIIEGNLYIKGTGDPQFRSQDMWSLVHRLEDLGIKRITGDIILDDGHFIPPAIDPGDFDNRPDRTYNALPGALLLDNRAVRISISATDQNQRPVVRAWPPNPNLDIRPKLTVSNQRCQWANRNPEIRITNPTEAHSRIEIIGDFSTQCRPNTIYRVAGDPADAFFYTFAELFSRTGGVIDGHWRGGTVSEQAVKIISHQSRTLSQYLWLMNKWSNNLMARQILLTLAAELHGAPATEDSARMVVNQWLQRRGLIWPGFYIDNGSGLSRDARITPQQLGTLLVETFNGPYMAELLSTLPIAGVDGTMRNRLTDEPVRGHAHIKTGTLRDVRAGAGYILTRSGQRYAVVMLHNETNVQMGGGTRVQDAVLRWLYENG